MKLFIPQNYKSILDLHQTEKAIKLLKDFFENALSSELFLRRVTAPLFVLKGTGINDDLNGVERAVSFPIKDMKEATAEVVHSLAKWKRMILADYKIEMGYGIYTDMNAIRPDEELDNLHSLYVDQWDWEKVISNDQRSLDYLKSTVNKIYSVLRRTEYIVYENYPEISPILPERITFLHAEELLMQYPELSPRERESKAAEKFGAIFVIGIGGLLVNGEKHDGRAPDYDDWSSHTIHGYRGLNGDIVVWNPILNQAFELSSMGIRVNQDALLYQLKETGNEARKSLYFHQRLLNGDFPLSIGGGIGQSRLCMFFLRKAHVGEIQTSIWPESMVMECEKNGITLM